MDMLFTLAYWIGIVKLIHTIYGLVRYIHSNRKKKSLRATYGNGWAVVSDATNHIGRQICLSLAERGFDLIIIGNQASKLHELEKEIQETQPHILFKILVVDFANSIIDKHLFDRVEKTLGEVDISMLIYNNTVIEEGNLIEVQERNLLTQLIVNQIPLVQLLKQIVPRLRAHITKNDSRAAIINVSSLVGDFPIPSHAVYGGTKGFTDYFTESVGLEYQDKNIDYLCSQSSLRRTSTGFKLGQTSEDNQKINVNQIWDDLGTLKRGGVSQKDAILAWMYKAISFAGPLAKLIRAGNRKNKN